MPRGSNEFPFTVYDRQASEGANHDHLLHVFEGYRDALVRPDDGNPYSPGSARALSWDVGFKQARNQADADADVVREARTLLTDAFIILQPDKPGFDIHVDASVASTWCEPDRAPRVHMRGFTAIYLFLRGFGNFCFTCKPLLDRKFHKAGCPLDPLGDWRR